MRNCFLLLFLFITAAATGQQHDTSNAPVVLKQLPTEGVLLDKDWKFMAGDNPAYADPQYDDRNWRPIDPTKDIHDLPQLWQGIAWFRLHFMVDSAIARSIAMEIQQSGASEIYLNGKLLHRLGVISTHSNEIRAFSPDYPLSLPISGNSEQVLAVRYTLQPHLNYSTHFGTENVGLTIHVNTLENGHYQYESAVYEAKANMFRAGVFAILGILYLAFYLILLKKLICSFPFMRCWRLSPGLVFFTPKALHQFSGSITFL